MHSKLGSPTVAIRSVRPRPQSDDLDPGGGHLLAEVERLDDAVHVQLPEMEEEDPHPTASRIASSCGSTLNGGSA